MSKRKLTRQQKWRIEKIQQERIDRAQDRVQRAETLVDSSVLGSEQDGLIVAHFGTQVEVEDTQLKRYRCLLRANVPALVTGDRVVWRMGPDNQGIVEAQYPRHSSLSRPDTRGLIKTVAANVDYIIIVIAPLPEPSTLLIDRYLVAAELAHIEPILLLNKIDLLSDAQLGKFNELIQSYRTIGYRAFSCSTKQDMGLQDINPLLRQHSFVFVGQSGVGKSSIINALLPGSDQQTAALSTSQLGVHTTTTARLFHTAEGGTLIDSPGIREFSLHLDDPHLLATGFREFRRYIGECQFRDCRHDHEPGCAIKNAAITGEINPKRLENYLKIAQTLSHASY